LPVGTGTRLADDVDFVPVAGCGLYLVAATFREERDVHRFVDGTLGTRLEVILRMCALIDDQPVANVACSAPVRSDGFRRATEPLVEYFFHRMAFIKHALALYSDVEAARDQITDYSSSR
jgi:hypothetical protein